jgi:allantoin racemase
VKKDIRIVTPIITRGIRSLDDVAPFVRPDLVFSHVLLDCGPPSIECEFDEVLSMPDTVRKAIEAERDGAAAIIIDCMGDPGVKACREAVSIPVLGPCETSMHLAAMLGQKFTVVTTVDSAKPMLVNNAKLFGVADRLASVRVVNVPVLDIGKDAGVLYSRMAEESLKAVLEDDADVIVLGCTGFCGAGEAVRQYLLEKLNVAIPVIDPIPATVNIAASLVDAGLAHSKKTYATPAPKKNIGYDMPPFLRATPVNA